jgi:hypothetical protein
VIQPQDGHQRREAQLAGLEDHIAVPQPAQKPALRPAMSKTCLSRKVAAMRRSKSV